MVVRRYCKEQLIHTGLGPPSHMQSHKRSLTQCKYMLNKNFKYSFDNLWQENIHFSKKVKVKVKKQHFVVNFVFFFFPDSKPTEHKTLVKKKQ